MMRKKFNFFFGFLWMKKNLIDWAKLSWHEGQFKIIKMGKYSKIHQTKELGIDTIDYHEVDPGAKKR